jgi:hypothetical protein
MEDARGADAGQERDRALTALDARFAGTCGKPGKIGARTLLKGAAASLLAWSAVAQPEDRDPAILGVLQGPAPYPWNVGPA